MQAARSVLATSYVFAYFFFGNDMYRDDFTPDENTRNQNLFEDQQQVRHACVPGQHGGVGVEMCGRGGDDPAQCDSSRWR